MTEKFANFKETRMDFYTNKILNYVICYWMPFIYFVLLKLKQILAYSYECVLPKLYKFCGASS